MLDLSTTHKIKKARHWYKEINQLYHPTGELGQEKEELVYSANSLNTAKFVPVLLKEWFSLIKKGAYLVIDYKPNKVCDFQKLEKNIWWLWREKYEIIFHGAIGKKEISNLNEQKLKKFIEYYEKYYKTNLDKKTLLPKPLLTKKNPGTENGYLRFVCRKTVSTKIKGDSINKWSFGIITNGKRIDWVEQIIESIRKQKIPHYEVIVCGKYYDKKEPNFKYLPFNQRDKLGWITKKKNLIVKNAKYENLCILHDRILLDKGWFKGMRKWGNCFEHLACVQHYHARRACDWLLHEKVGKSEFGFATLLDYRDWDINVFQSGPLHIIKRSLVREVPWNESYFWGEPEDLEISRKLGGRGYILRCNPYSKFNVLLYRFGKLPIVPFNRLRLSKKRKGNIIRICGRRFYKHICKAEVLKKIFIRSLKLFRYN